MTLMKNVEKKETIESKKTCVGNQEAAGEMSFNEQMLRTFCTPTAYHTFQTNMRLKPQPQTVDQPVTLKST
jgi:hypothetical protein